MNRLTTCLIILLFFGCRDKKRDSEKSYFSVVEFLQSEARQMDTAHYTILKIETADGRTDTTTIPAKDFRKYANDFLSLPDISSDNRHKDYEETNVYDEDLKSVLLTYMPKNDKEQIRRETVILTPNEVGPSDVKTILVNRIIPGKNETVEKELTWHVDHRFQVVTKTTRGNEPEKISTMVITWK
jgi:hypothetical protein